MIRLLVFFLVAFGVANVAGIVPVNVSAFAEGRAKCRPGPGFGPGQANVSIILRRYVTGDGPPKKPLEERILATVPVKNGEYSLSGAGKGSNLGTGVKLFLLLKYNCNGKMSVEEVQIPDNFVAQIPDGVIITVPPKAFEHDFDIYFDGP